MWVDMMREEAIFVATIMRQNPRFSMSTRVVCVHEPIHKKIISFQYVQISQLDFLCSSRHRQGNMSFSRGSRTLRDAEVSYMLLSVANRITDTPEVGILGIDYFH